MKFSGFLKRGKVPLFFILALSLGSCTQVRVNSIPEKLPDQRGPSSTLTATEENNVLSCIEKVCGKAADFPVPPLDEFLSSRNPAFERIWPDYAKKIESLVVQDSEYQQVRANKALGLLKDPQRLSKALQNKTTYTRLAYSMIWKIVLPETEKKLQGAPSALDSPAASLAFAKKQGRSAPEREGLSMVLSAAAAAIDRLPGVLDNKQLATNSFKALSMAVQEAGPILSAQISRPDLARKWREILASPRPELFGYYESQSDLRRAAVEASLLATVFKGPSLEILSRYPIRLGELINSVTGDEDFMIRLENFAKAASFAKAESHSLNAFCQSSGQKLYNSDPTETERKYFQDMTSGVIQTSRKIALNFFPAQTQSYLNKAFEEDLSVVMPLSFSIQISQFGSVLEEWSRWERSALSSVSPAADAVDADILSAWLWQRPFGLSSQLRSQECVKLSPPVQSDKFDSVLDKDILISWASIKYPKYGAGVLAHEMGHWVGARAEKYLRGWPLQELSYHKSKNCVALRNPKNLSVKALSSISDDLTYSNEDWADHFSSLVLEKLEGEKLPQVNCFTLPRNPDGSWNADLALNGFWKDTYHSPGVLRLIFGLRDRGQPLSQCTALQQQIWKNKPVERCQ